MTAEELEDYHHSPSDDEIPTLTPTLRGWLLLDGMDSSPEEENRARFESRPPALGMTPDISSELKSHYATITPIQQRQMFSLLRGHMLRQLISCDGADKFEALVDILENEMKSGTPAPVPQWYKFSDVRMGPRKIGYDGCSNRGCFRTETTERQFGKCTGCRTAVYCKKDCQKQDWKARHKKVCKEAAQQREKIQRVSQMLSMFGAAGR